MQCPKCPGLLRVEKIEQIKVHYCLVCHGLWLSEQKLEAILRMDETQLSASDVDAANWAIECREVKEIAGKCPVCEDNTWLELRPYPHSRKQVLLDFCPKGHGWWVDGGKLPCLRRRSYKMLFITLLAMGSIVALCVGMYMYCLSLKGLGEEQHHTQQRAEEDAQNYMKLFAGKPFMPGPGEKKKES